MDLTALPTGTVVNDRYELLTKLGSTGSVYEAADRNLDIHVALKFLKPGQDETAGPWDEARRLEQLRSRFLLDVLNADVVQGADIRFIATPIVSHGDLEASAAGAGLSLTSAVRLVVQAATGLARIHAAGMVHRDVKPGNVLLNGDEALLADLEFCELLDTDGRAGRNGTWCTVAPEAMPKDGCCSIPGDVYSLAATAFYALAGEYPVDHRLPADEQARLVQTGQLRELRDLAPHVPQAVGTIIRAGLRPDPAERTQTVSEFSNALAHAVRNTRDWRRQDHAGHRLCLIGESHDNRSEVRVCCVDDADFVAVSARHFNGRRIANVVDQKVKAGALPKTVRALVRSLR